VSFPCPSVLPFGFALDGWVCISYSDELFVLHFESAHFMGSSPAVAVSSGWQLI
jgi:hypothetical protein